jgi:hypothetical protein
VATFQEISPLLLLGGIYIFCLVIGMQTAVKDLIETCHCCKN